MRALLRLHICEIEISFSNLFSLEQIPERSERVCIVCNGVYQNPYRGTAVAFVESAGLFRVRFTVP